MARSVAHPTSSASEEDDSGSFRIEHLPPIWERQLPPPSLPIGVGILAFASAALGVLLVVSGILFVLNYYASLIVPASLVIVHVGAPVTATVLVILGVVVLILSTALWRQELWSFYLMVGFLFLGLAYLFFTGSLTYLFVIVLVVFIYLIAVRHHFY